MSYNNYVDLEAAWRAAYDHADPAVAIIKHTNPCGIAVGANIESAYLKAHACDPISAFGGVIAANREVNETVAKAVSEVFTEVIAAPSFTKAALEILSKNLQSEFLQLSQRHHSWSYVQFWVGHWYKTLTELMPRVMKQEAGN